MKKEDIYSKKNLESFVYDLLTYLYKTKVQYGDYPLTDIKRLSEDVLIYSMNNLYYIDEVNPTTMIKKTPVRIEENVDVAEYLDYYNKDTLTLSMDSILCEYLYYYDVPGCEEIADKVFKIFEKHGFFHDFGTNTTIFAWTTCNHPYFI